MLKKVEPRCNHIELEHQVLNWWQDTEAFDKLRRKNAGKKPWSFLDGPITANNPMGVHHAWGRTLKDAYQRYHAMMGYELRYQNGFDCQGLWVEVEVEKELGYKCKADIQRAGLEDFINRCKERVEKYSKIQTEQSIRLGYWMDWNNSYYTMSDENNYTIWTFLKKCHERGLIYKGLDAMPWCPRCETAISEQERREGYKNIEDTAVYVQLPLMGRQNEYILVWTTTPWTLAANVACAVNPKLKYARVKQNGNIYYLAESLVKVMREKGEYTIEGTISGSEMIGWEYKGPFDELEAVKKAFVEKSYTHRIIAWDDVSESEGVGIVHIAPGCGKEDFDLGRTLQLPILMPIDEAGIYFDDYGFLSGSNAGNVARQVLENLRGKGLYYKVEKYEHDYPHCWRCATPLLFRAVDEWYISMSWRREIMEVVKNIRWIPQWGKDLELNWLENMGDWMISKKRFWGLALPIFECECGCFDVIGGKEELKERAVRGWEKFQGHSPHRPWIDAIQLKCPECGRPMSRIPDVGNPWLDAGIVPYSTVKYNTDRRYWQKWIPADLVLECFPGQFRNWFYSLLAMSTMMEGRAPFRTLLGHALVRDEQGKEMHKSAGNTIWFDEAVEKMGADLMRWIYCAQNPTNNLNFGYGIAQQLDRRLFSTWWNVYSFFVNYARLDGFDPNVKAVAYEQLQDIDRWLLSKLQELIRAANEALADFNVSLMVQHAESFIERLSNWYVRRNRRRFWRPKNESDTDKLAAYQTLYRVLVDVCKILAPVVPFITEQMYQNLVRSFDSKAAESVHHCDYPQFDERLYNEKLINDMDMVADVVSRVLSIREAKQIRVRQPLRRLIVVSDGSSRKVLKDFESHILEELNVKRLELVDSLDEYVRYEIKPNLKIMGPKFGRNMRTIMNLLAEQPAKETALTLDNGKSIVLDTDGNHWELQPEDIIVERNFTDNLVVSDNVKPVLAVDTEITEELRKEGLTRDIVRHIQQMRKEMGLEIQDHIRLSLEIDSADIQAAVGEHKTYICRETLCDEITESGATKKDCVKQVRIGGSTVKLAVTKID